MADRTTYTHAEFADDQECLVGEYPKFKYHAEKEPVVVASKEDETALGEGWVDTPEAE